MKAIEVHDLKKELQNCQKRSRDRGKSETFGKP